MEDLPEELLSKIFLRLSVKDLLRSKVTCSRWNSLIRNGYFAREHAERDKYGSNIIMTFFDTGLYMVGRDSLLNGQPYRNKFSWNGKSYDSCSYIVVGSCNGLVCLLRYGQSILLVWNPATREICKIRNVVPVIDEVSLGGKVPLGSLDFFIFGFGYDHRSDDYKILTMQQPGIGRLCSLKSNLVSPILQKDFPWKACNLYNRYALYLKGSLHWSLLNSDNSLVSFDLKDESFVWTLLLPEGLTAAPTWLRLGVIEDCLCMYVQLLDHSGEVWIMKEYSVRSSWTRLFEINDQSFPLTPLVGMPDGKILFSGDTPCFTVYDPREDTVSQGKTYSEEYLSRQWFLRVPWAYKESVISPCELFSVEDTSRTKQLSGVPYQSRIKQTSQVKIILDSNPNLRAIDCDSLLNSQSSAHRFLWMGESYECHRVAGSCNGLVLLEDYSKREFLWLWNPTTREVRKIRIMVHDFCYWIIAHGFGYDPLSDDYKIVTIYHSHPRIAQIRCLKRDTWKTIPVPSQAGEMLGNYRGVHLNGVLHWSALNANGSIMSFNLHEEIFPNMLLLPETATAKTDSLGVGVIGDCLSICIPTVEGGQGQYEVWMMKEYGVRSSWTLVFRTEGLTRPLIPFAVTGDGKVILDEGGDYFRVYDPTQGWLSLEKAYTNELLFCDTWTYQETLVSPHTLEDE